MDSIISLGQKNTLAEYMILFGVDNRPPMLDKDLYDSWRSRMELYMQNREHGRMILESVEHGPLIWPTVEENRVIRTKKYAELSATEKIQADYDMKATNIILQGDDLIACLNKAMAFLTAIASSRKGLLNATIVKTEDLDTYDYNCDDLSTAQAILMANISNYGSEVILEVPHLETYLNDMNSQRDDLIACLNKAMAFLTAIASSSLWVSPVHCVPKKGGFTIVKNEENELIPTRLVTGWQRSEYCEKCLNLDAEFSKSKQAYDDLLKSYSQLEKHCISLELSIQLNQEIFQKNESCITQNAPEIPKYFKKNDLKAQLQDKDTTISQLQDKDTTICKLKDTIKSLRKNNKEEIVDHDRCDLVTINEELENSVAKLLSENKRIYKEINHVQQEKADILRGIVEQAKSKKPLDNALDFSCKHARRIQELLVYVQDTCPTVIKLSETKVARTLVNKIKKVTFAEPITSSSTNKEIHDSNKPMLHSTGVKCSTSASGSNPSGNTKNNKISQPSSKNKINKVEDKPRSVKTRKNKKNRVNKVKCNDHVMQSMSNANSVSVSIKNAPVKDYVNDVKYGCLCAIYGQTFTIVGNSCPLTRFTSINVVSLKQTPSHLVEIQKPKIKVYSRKPKKVNNVGSSKMAKIVESKNANHSKPNHTWGSIAIDIPSSSSLVMTARYGLVRGLPKLKFKKNHLCSACSMGKSKKKPHKPKSEDTNQENLYLLHMDLCGLTRVASVNGKNSGPMLDLMTAATSSTGLVSNLVSQQPCIPPNTDDWICLFQPMFDEYFNPPSIAVSPVQEAAASRAEVLADSPVSTSINQDAPSTSIPSSQEEKHSPIIYQGFKESSKTPTFHDDPLNESPHEDLTSQGSSVNVRQIHNPFEHLRRWTRDHLLENVIRDPSRSVSIRKQLETVAMWCYFDAFLTSVDPKNFKQAMTEPSWIDAMQEEIHEFETLEV
nr:integrase, catalytic region, zinc finger, CCHC-type, peptidase aspartic, catalytic [Tanacetum cinerariifolium]